MSEFEVSLQPGEQAQLLSDIKAFDAELAKSLSKNIRGIIVPIGRRMIRDVVPELPRAGGLAARVEKARAGASIRNSATARTSAGASLIFRRPRVLRYIDKGEIPHPVFANVKKPRASWTWRTQSIRAHTLTEAFDRDGGAEARRAVERAVTEAARTIRAGTA